MRGTLKYLNIKTKTNKLSTDKLCSSIYPAKNSDAFPIPSLKPKPTPNTTADSTHRATILTEDT
nr:hypothetical protein Iba_chr12fCG3760 [Ipomoea batatas]